VLVPAISEIIEILEATEKFDPYDISDKSSGIYNSMSNLGTLISPLLSAALMDLVGYRTTCDIMLVGTFIFTIFFYFTMIFRRNLPMPKPNSIVDGH